MRADSKTGTTSHSGSLGSDSFSLGDLITVMKIHFVVVGGSLTGYGCALTLCRAGHSVTVLDVEDKLEAAWGPYGVTVPPNLSKLLVRWGLGDELEACGTKSRRVKMCDYHSGEVFGFHNLEAELMKDAGGDITYVHLSDLKRMLRDRAVSYGAEIREGVTVLSISVQGDCRPSARLTSGEVIEADVLIGADGSNSLVRREITGQEFCDSPLGLALFNVRIPAHKMKTDPTMAAFLDDKHTSTVWIGERSAGMALPAGSEISVFVYTPDTNTEPYWYQNVPNAELIGFMGTCAPLLRKLAESASSVTCVPLGQPPEVEPWVRGRVVLVGEAAHPFPRVAVHGAALNVCDAGALGALFMKLHTNEQIDSFLKAFESLRRPRTKKVLQIEMLNIYYLALPPGEFKDARDNGLRTRGAAGKDMFSAMSSEDEDVVKQQWDNDKMLFSYDAEEHALEWWNDWGLLNERANDAVIVPEEQIPVLQVVEEVQVVAAPPSPDPPTRV
ncbi:hypothetical protein BC835DRAFT_1325529 [Cytidiella melzeri]|nr:hypothetical protein BC835DRAFT_1325529 [Cytidiella melzeri]